MNILEKYLNKNPCYANNVGRIDSRYRKFQDEGPKKLMLHSVGCSQPSAKVFYNGWNKASYDRACVHAFIDSNTGDIWQTLPWNFRGWHCGSGVNGSANNTDIGVELCETSHISYYTGTKFNILDRTKAVEDCVRSYNAAVELFAYLCICYGLDPLTDIRSHKEGSAQGVASNHGDPDHYWKGLGMNYTMDGFRAAVKQKMEEECMNAEQLNSILDNFKNDVLREVRETVDGINNHFKEKVDAIITERMGPPVKEVGDKSIKSYAHQMQKLLDAGAINGGTSEEENPNDINFGNRDDVRVMAVLTAYIDKRFEELKNLIAIRSEE